MPGRKLKEIFQKDFEEAVNINEIYINTKSVENPIILRTKYLFMWKVLNMMSGEIFSESTSGEAKENAAKLKNISIGKYSKEFSPEVEQIGQNLKKVDFIGIRHIPVPEEFYPALCGEPLSDEQAKDMGARWALKPQIDALKGLKGEEKINETAKVIFLWKYLTGRYNAPDSNTYNSPEPLLKEAKVAAVMEFVEHFVFPSMDMGDTPNPVASGGKKGALDERYKKMLEQELMGIRARTEAVLQNVKTDVLPSALYPYVAYPDLALSVEDLKNLNPDGTFKTGIDNTEIDGAGPKLNEIKNDPPKNEIKLTTQIQKESPEKRILNEMGESLNSVKKEVKDNISEFKTVEPVSEDTLRDASVDITMRIISYGQHSFKEALEYASGKKNLNELSELFKSDKKIGQKEKFAFIRDALKNYSIPQIDYKDMTQAARIHREMQFADAFANTMIDYLKPRLKKNNQNQPDNEEMGIFRDVYAYSLQLKELTGDYMRGYVVTKKQSLSAEYGFKILLNRLSFTRKAIEFYGGRTLGEVTELNRQDQIIEKTNQKMDRDIGKEKLTEYAIISYLRGTDSSLTNKFADVPAYPKQDKQKDPIAENPNLMPGFKPEAGIKINVGNEIKDEIKNEIKNDEIIQNPAIKPEPEKENIINPGSEIENGLKNEIKGGIEEEKKPEEPKNEIIDKPEEKEPEQNINDLFGQKPVDLGFRIYQPAAFFSENDFTRVIYYAIVEEGMNLTQALDKLMDFKNDNEFAQRYNAWDQKDTEKKAMDIMSMDPVKRANVIEKLHSALSSNPYSKIDFNNPDQVEKLVHKNIVLLPFINYLNEQNDKIEQNLPQVKVSNTPDYQKEAAANRKALEMNQKLSAAKRGLASFCLAFSEAFMLSDGENTNGRIPYALIAARRVRFHRFCDEIFQNKSLEEIGNTDQEILLANDEELMLPRISENDAIGYLQKRNPQFEQFVKSGIPKKHEIKPNIIQDPEYNLYNMNLASYGVAGGMIEIPKEFIDKGAEILQYGLRHEKMSLNEILRIANGSTKDLAFMERMKKSKNEDLIGETTDPELGEDAALAVHLKDTWEKLRTFTVPDDKLYDPLAVERAGRTYVVLHKYVTDMVQTMETMKDSALEFNKAGYSTRKLYSDVTEAYRTIQKLTGSFVEGYQVQKETNKFNLDGSLIADKDIIVAAIHRAMFKLKTEQFFKNGYSLENIIENGKAFELLDKQEAYLVQNTNLFDAYDALNYLTRYDDTFLGHMNNLLKDLPRIMQEEEEEKASVRGDEDNINIQEIHPNPLLNENPNPNPVQNPNQNKNPVQVPGPVPEPQPQPEPEPYDYIKAMGFIMPNIVPEVNEGEDIPVQDDENAADNDPVGEILEEDIELIDEEFDPVAEEENRIVEIEQLVGEIENYVFPDINWGDPKDVSAHAGDLKEITEKVELINAKLAAFYEKTTGLVEDGPERINRLRVTVDNANEFVNAYKPAYYATHEMAEHMVENPGVDDLHFMHGVAKKRALFAVKVKARFVGNALKDVVPATPFTRFAETEVRNNTTPHLSEANPKDYLEGNAPGYENWVKLHYEDALNKTILNRNETIGKFMDLPKTDFRAFVLTENNLVEPKSLKNDFLAVFTTKTTGEILHKRIFGTKDPIFEGETNEQISERMERADRIRNKVNLAFEKLFTPAERDALLKAGKTELDAIKLNGVSASDVFNFAQAKYEFLNDKPLEKELMIKTEIINEFMRGKNEITKDYYAIDEQNNPQVMGSVQIVKGTRSLIAEKKFFDKIRQIHQSFTADTEFWNTANHGPNAANNASLNELRTVLNNTLQSIDPDHLQGKTYGEIVNSMHAYKRKIANYELNGGNALAHQKYNEVTGIIQEFETLGSAIGLDLPAAGQRESYKNSFDKLLDDYNTDSVIRGFDKITDNNFYEYYFPDGKSYPELTASFNRDLGINHIGGVFANKTAAFGKRLLNTGNNSAVLEKVQQNVRFSSAQGLFNIWLLGHKGVSVEDAVRLQDGPIMVGNEQLDMDTLHQEYINFCAQNPVMGDGITREDLQAHIANWFNVYRACIAKVKEYRIPNTNLADLEKRAPFEKNLFFISNLMAELVQEMDDGIMKRSNPDSRNYAIGAAGGFEEYQKVVGDLEVLQIYFGSVQKTLYISDSPDKERNLENFSALNAGNYVTKIGVPNLYIYPVLDNYKGMTVGQLLEGEELDSMHTVSLIPSAKNALIVPEYDGRVMDDVEGNPDLAISHILGVNKEFENTIANDKNIKTNHYKTVIVPNAIKEDGAKFFNTLVTEAVASYPEEQRNAALENDHFYNEIAGVADDAPAMRAFLKTPLVNGDTPERWLLRSIDKAYGIELRKALSISGTSFCDLFLVEGQTPSARWGAKYDALEPAPDAFEKEKLLLLEVIKAYKTGSKIEARTWSVSNNPIQLTEGTHTVISEGLNKINDMIKGFNDYEVLRDHAYNELLRIKENLAATQDNKEANFVDGKGEEGTGLYKSVTGALKDLMKALERHKEDGRIKVSDIHQKLTGLKTAMDRYYTERHKVLIGAFTPTGRKKQEIMQDASNTLTTLIAYHLQYEQPFLGDEYTLSQGKQMTAKDANYCDIRKMANQHKKTMQIADPAARETVENQYVRNRFQEDVNNLQHAPMPEVPKGATAENMEKAWTYLKNYYRNRLTSQQNKATLDDLNSIKDVKSKAQELCKDRIFLGALNKPNYNMVDYWPRVEKRVAQLTKQFKDDLKLVSDVYQTEEAYIADIKPNPGESLGELKGRALEKIFQVIVSAQLEETFAQYDPHYHMNEAAINARKKCYERMSDLLIRQVTLEDKEIGNRMMTAIASKEDYYRSFHEYMTRNLMEGKALGTSKAVQAMKAFRDKSLGKAFVKSYINYSRGEGAQLINQEQINQNYLNNQINHNPDQPANPQVNGAENQPNQGGIPLLH